MYSASWSWYYGLSETTWSKPQQKYTATLILKKLINFNFLMALKK